MEIPRDSNLMAISEYNVAIVAPYPHEPHDSSAPNRDPVYAMQATRVDVGTDECIELAVLVDEVFNPTLN